MLAALCAATVVQAVDDPGLRDTLAVLSRGVFLTIRITVAGFALALALGVVAGIGRTWERRGIRELCTVYVEFVRGVPLLVLILWIGLGLTPWLVQGLRALVDAVAGTDIGAAAAPLSAWLEPCRRPRRCVPMEVRGVIGLGIGYGAYIAEIVRAGIESVSLGQREAAASLGMNRWQSLRFVILPQAARVALPPLGNDLVAMLKDSSLVSLLAVPELVQQARFHISRTFEPFEVWNMVALTYLVMTTVLSLAVQRVEARFSRGHR